MSTIPPVKNTNSLVTKELCINIPTKSSGSSIKLIDSLPSPPSSGGKRSATGPLITTSDEESSGPDSPQCSPRGERSVSSSSLSPSLLHDHDYENVSSPGSSSTASGPTYAPRPPGFTQHAHSVTVPKPRYKKKKTFTPVKDEPGTVTTVIPKEPTPPKSKPKREPMPMRMRALPQSFWQQPNVPQNISPACNYPVLPPLFTRDGAEIEELQPISPDGERDRKHTPKVHSTEKQEQKLTIANTDLLFKLFENVEKERKTKTSSSSQLNSTFPSTSSGSSSSNTAMKRGRPRKVVHVVSKNLISGEDPYLLDSFSEKLFPTLSLDNSKGGGSSSGSSAAPTLHVVTIREGDRSVTLPSLSVEQNYSQMLSELVMHI